MASMLKGFTISLVPCWDWGAIRNRNATYRQAQLRHITLTNSEEVMQSCSWAISDSTHGENNNHSLCLSPEVKKNFYLVLSPPRTSFMWLHIRSLYDEVHTAVQNYVSFRPDFRSAMDFLHLLVSTARTATNGSYLYVPILARMSATFTMSDQDSFNKLIRRQPTMVF